MSVASSQFLPRLVLASAIAAGLGGCAAPARGPLVVEKPSSSVLPGGMTPQAAQSAITVGQSTRADVAAALGQATIVRFDSGYEVWVYQTAGADRRDPTELVILFAPSGVVKKTRLRLGAAVRK
ncbi:MAG TPA: hypothetical protein VKD22_12005 [Ramlibacter sp.]|nr:hypothetical protein [Ramlibacter sp.]